jgi:hypothetical protein
VPVTFHVVPAEDGGWTVRGDANGGNGSKSFFRKRDAEAFAKDLVRDRGGGEVVLHTPSGRVTEVDTVVPESS